MRLHAADNRQLPPVAAPVMDADILLPSNTFCCLASLVVRLGVAFTRTDPSGDVNDRDRATRRVQRTRCMVVHFTRFSGRLPDGSASSSTLGVPDVPVWMDVRAAAYEHAD